MVRCPPEPTYSTGTKRQILSTVGASGATPADGQAQTTIRWHRDYALPRIQKALASRER
jgi:hypothetical protein